MARDFRLELIQNRAEVTHANFFLGTEKVQNPQARRVRKGPKELRRHHIHKNEYDVNPRPGQAGRGSEFPASSARRTRATSSRWFPTSSKGQTAQWLRSAPSENSPPRPAFPPQRCGTTKGPDCSVQAPARRRIAGCIRNRNLSGPASSERHRQRDSPSRTSSRSFGLQLRANGRDIEPAARKQTEFGLSCRMLSGLTLLVEAVKKAGYSASLVEN